MGPSDAAATAARWSITPSASGMKPRAVRAARRSASVITAAGRRVSGISSTTATIAAPDRAVPPASGQRLAWPAVAELHPLRVALLGYRGNPYSGGQGVYIRQLSAALTRLGHKVTVFSGQPYPELEDSVPLVRVPSLDLYRTDDPFRTPRLREFRDWVDVLEYATWCRPPSRFSRKAAILEPGPVEPSSSIRDSPTSNITASMPSDSTTWRWLGDRPVSRSYAATAASMSRPAIPTWSILFSIAPSIGTRARHSAHRAVAGRR